jgi:hypothetical protein
MKAVELHAYSSGEPIRIVLEQITQIGSMGDDGHGYVEKINGKDVEVKESYGELAKLLPIE